MSDFINTVPDFIDDLTAGRGPLGWLQDDYQIVDRIRAAIEKQGPGGVLGLSEPVLDVVRSVVTAVVGFITIIFLTFFMLLEGPRTVESLLDLLPDSARPRYERVGRDIYKTISGYVTGNLLISVIAGTLATVDALRRRQRVRDRARPARRGARSHPAGRRDARGDHRLDRDRHRDRTGSAASS